MDKSLLVYIYIYTQGENSNTHHFCIIEKYI